MDFTKAAFILQCNTPALPMYWVFINHSTICTSSQVHFITLLQCGCRDGNSTTATHRNTNAVASVNEALHAAYKILVKWHMCASD